MRALTLCLICLQLAACAPPDLKAVSDGPAPTDATCGADTLSAYIGQPASTLPATGPWGTIRVINPGMMITMDYSATRLDVRVDAANRILSMTCG